MILKQILTFVKVFLIQEMAKTGQKCPFILKLGIFRACLFFRVLRAFRNSVNV